MAQWDEVGVGDVMAQVGEVGSDVPAGLTAASGEEDPHGWCVPIVLADHSLAAQVVRRPGGLQLGHLAERRLDPDRSGAEVDRQPTCVDPDDLTESVGVM